MSRYEPPSSWIRLQTIDIHVAGEPLRIVVDGYPEIPGATILEKRRYAREHLDHLRRALIYEPRGHADMYGCVLTAPVTDDGDLGVLFMHNDGYSTMCGHGVIGLVTAGLECGLFVENDRDEVRIDTPAGRVTAVARRDRERVVEVSFDNVASFVVGRDLPIELPGRGTLRCDLAFGGAFYAYVDAASVGLELAADHFTRIVEAGIAIKAEVIEQYPVHHPAGDSDLEYLYGVIFTAPGHGGVHSRHVCVFAAGEVDRSPTGTGVSGRAALLHAAGELAVGEHVRIDSITGEVFDVAVAEEIAVGKSVAVIPRVTGSGHLTGRHEFWVDPADPLGDGFLLR